MKDYGLKFLETREIFIIFIASSEYFNTCSVCWRFV